MSALRRTVVTIKSSTETCPLKLELGRYPETEILRSRVSRAAIRLSAIRWTGRDVIAALDIKKEHRTKRTR
jgi:hypothetical protein